MKKGTKKKSLLLFILIFSLFFFSVNSVIDVKSATRSSQNPILFVHGWTGNAMRYNTMLDRFYFDGWPLELLKTFTFGDSYDYSSTGNILNANSIANWVDNILNKTGAEKVDIVAHSMGGLSSRYYIKFLGGLSKVDDFVSMGSPQHGVYGGTKVFQTNNSFLYSLNEGDETPGGILNDTIGLRVDPLGGRSYNSTHIPGNINYTAISSTGDFIAFPIITSNLDGANNIVAEGVEHVEMLYDEGFYNIIKHAVYDGNSKQNDNIIPGYNLLMLIGFISLLIIKIIKKQKFK